MKDTRHYIVQFIGSHWANGISGQYRKVGGGATHDIEKADVITISPAHVWDDERPVWGPDGTTGETWVAHRLIETDRALT